MRDLSSRSFLRPAVVAAIAFSMAMLPLVPGAPARAAHVSASPSYLTAVQTSGSTFTRNFNPFQLANRRDFTNGAIYEPLMVITTAGTGHTYPWLATKYRWANHNKEVIVTLRRGVKWSDGKPFTAADVVFTFNYGKKYAIADETGLMQTHLITKVQALGKYQVAFHFSTVNTLVLPTLLSTNVMIVPQHIWSKVTDPTTFANPNPVGTGPFARVQSFSSQVYVLGRNPYYWQKLHYAGIKVPALNGNDSELAALLSHQLDWVGLSIANVQATFINHDRTHNHAFLSNQTVPLALFFNDQQYPYSLPVFRKAVSLAINRKQVWKVGESGNEPPADAVGLKQLFPKWVDPKVEKTAKALATYNPGKAKQLLKKAGFTYKGSALYDPHGKAVSVTLQVPADWNDWDTSMQIMANNLKAIGIDASFQGMTDNAFFDQRSKRLFSPIYYQTGPGPDPYFFFYSYMSKQSYFPVGQNALAGSTGNLEGWYNQKATNLLAKYRTITNMAEKHRIINQLQQIQVTYMPVIPTVYQAAWFENTTAHFTGFPTKQHNYAIGSPYQYPDDVRIMTKLKPVK
jgi:peptide/nickel transport system substrate-binding protein